MRASLASHKNFLFRVLIFLYFSSSYTAKPVVLGPVYSIESGLGSMSLSSGSVPSTTSGALVSSTSVPLDLSTGGSIVAGLPSSPTAISETCESVFILL